MEHYSREHRLNLCSYEERREALYGPLYHEGIFTWDRLYGQEYALADMYRLDPAELEAMRTAAEALGRIYARTITVVQQSGPELLAELGLPEAAYGAIRLIFDREVPTMIGRFDFARTREGWKMLEFNSDTPTGIVEAFYVNGRICTALGERDPNAGCALQLKAAFNRQIEAYRAAGYSTERVVFSALDWHEEDAGTTRYLLFQSGIKHAEFVPLSALHVIGEGVYTADGDVGTPIDVLYRLHALEKLAEDRDEDGYPTGQHMLQLIAERRLAIINPPSGFAAQTKALQALIWNLHETGQFYTPEEHAAIAAHMLPTSMEPCFAEGTAYVKKPVFGREGSGITVYGKDGSITARSEEEEYLEQPMVYQQYAELPEIEVETQNGAYRGRLLWGCFLIDGQASAVIARVGGTITGNLSYYLPSALGPERALVDRIHRGGSTL